MHLKAGKAVAAWLCGIIVNLLMLGGYFDIACVTSGWRSGLPRWRD